MLKCGCFNVLPVIKEKENTTSPQKKCRLQLKTMVWNGSWNPSDCRARYGRAVKDAKQNITMWKDLRPRKQ